MTRFCICQRQDYLSFNTRHPTLSDFILKWFLFHIKPLSCFSIHLLYSIYFSKLFVVSENAKALFVWNHLGASFQMPRVMKQCCSPFSLYCHPRPSQLITKHEKSLETSLSLRGGSYGKQLVPKFQAHLLEGIKRVEPMISLTSVERSHVWFMIAWASCQGYQCCFSIPSALPILFLQIISYVWKIYFIVCIESLGSIISRAKGNLAMESANVAHFQTSSGDL